ncbi:hypothetical protein [Sporosarcina globispora]|uniref:hypothetical protein n=1 Tax=Sporosarcina globispora TaxID=1459 RepID=UPI000B259DFB|nr:hypothetical protein [Sporosarcina globispora]
MKPIDRNSLNEKRDELMIQLLEEGYTSKELSVIFNKHVLDIEEVLEKKGYGLINKNN